MITTYLETRYVDRAALNALLQGLFGQSYNVEARSRCIEDYGLGISLIVFVRSLAIQSW